MMVRACRCGCRTVPQLIYSSSWCSGRTAASQGLLVC
ncbi:RNA-binding protein [Zea mays]|uniref:RNA-binding protein n=1 Tax=Zea mays TaxID=4577 RepID=A0A1D6KRK6_MAIZE|nr:RNA-binding protein [Zea mays]